MKELETNDFGSIFRAFNERESIYGFGDLQVRRMFDKLTQQD
jgi:Holliday junction resolvasome RuvABC DNA-binding subunit